MYLVLAKNENEKKKERGRERERESLVCGSVVRLHCTEQARRRNRVHIFEEGSMDGSDLKGRRWSWIVTV